MPTPEEIKKIAVSYSVSRPAEEMPTNPAMAQMIVADALKWLSKDFVIVPKSKVKEVYNCYKQHEQVTDKKGLHDAMLIARGSIATMHDIFGTELFNEEK